jgi:hypothetical protein
VVTGRKIKKLDGNCAEYCISHTPWPSPAAFVMRFAAAAILSNSLACFVFLLVRSGPGGFRMEECGRWMAGCVHHNR